MADCIRTQPVGMQSQFHCFRWGFDGGLSTQVEIPSELALLLVLFFLLLLAVHVVKGKKRVRVRIGVRVSFGNNGYLLTTSFLTATNFPALRRQR